MRAVNNMRAVDMCREYCCNRTAVTVRGLPHLQKYEDFCYLQQHEYSNRTAVAEVRYKFEIPERLELYNLPDTDSLVFVLLGINP